MTDTKFNGWTNQQTWLVNLWITNDQYNCDYWHETAAELLADNEENSEAVFELANQLEGHFDEMLDETDNVHTDSVPGLFRDFLTTSLDLVDWRELAASYLGI